MPYIKKVFRSPMDTHIEELAKLAQTPGDLNYIISRLASLTLHYEGKSYNVLNALVGALECAKLEMYRRVAAPYEDLKIVENGDVYTDEVSLLTEVVVAERIQHDHGTSNP
jgi:hypothetical protein